MTRSFTTPFLALDLLVSAASAAQPPASASRPAATAPQPAATSPAPVPDAVKQAFQKKFPTAANPVWTPTADHNFQAAFTVQQAATTAQFDPAGKWRETKTSVPQSAIPSEALQAVRAQTSGYKITATYSLERPGADGLTYQALLDNGKDFLTAEVTPEGAIIDLTSTPKP